MRRWIVSMVLVGACSPAPAAPTAATSDVQLAPPGEPGQALTIPGERFLVYQATAKGDYEASDPGDERTARLRAVVTTDATGRFALRTILPGAYGDPLGDPHLHVEVSGARPSMHSIYFEGFVQDSTIGWAKTTEQGHVVPVTRGDGGALAAEVTLPVRGVSR
jgi:hypothetical protein